MSYIGGHLENCPLPRSKAAGGTYFRLLPSGTLCEQDFKSRARLCEEGEDYRNVDTNKCEEHAVSLGTSYLALCNLKKKYKQKYAQAKIAKVVLNNTHGRIDQDSANHANWWHPVELNPVSIAEIFEELST